MWKSFEDSGSSLTMALASRAFLNWLLLSLVPETQDGQSPKFERVILPNAQMFLQKSEGLAPRPKRLTMVQVIVNESLQLSPEPDIQGNHEPLLALFDGSGRDLPLGQPAEDVFRIETLDLEVDRHLKGQLHHPVIQEGATNL